MLHSLKKMFKSNYLFTFGVIICLFWIIMAIIAPFVAPYDPVVQDLTLRLKAPSAAHIFGTDNFGRDIFSRVIYGGRYSLLSAIDREGTIGVGVSLPEAGMYSIGIPEDCEAEDYEYVMLKDAATGKAADLKEGAYSFRTAEAGVAEGRFTLSFKRMDADQRHAIYVKSGMGKATVFGVNDGDVVTVVTVDGKVVAVEEAVGSEVTFALAKGAYLFKVAGADGRTTVVKAMVR